MDYKGLYIDFEEFGESYSGCHCTVYSSENMEHEIDDFFISPSVICGEYSLQGFLVNFLSRSSSLH